MDPSSYRAVIYYLAKKGEKPQEIHKHIVETYGENAPDKSTVSRWVNNMKWGRKDLETRKSSGRPPEANTPTKINAVRLAVANNPKISLRQLAQEVNLGRENVKIILNTHLHMQKLLARWVPHSLSADQKATRVAFARETLKTWSHRWSRLRSRIITVDETWVAHHSTPNRLSDGEWRPKGSEPPQIPRLPSDRRKLLAVVFWGSEGILHIEWFKSTKEQRGLNGALYEQMIERMHAKLLAKNPEKVKRGLMLLQDNAPCHKTLSVRKKLDELNIKTLPHPPFSPDLAPSDFYLFRVLKNHLTGKKFETDDELVEEVERFFDSKPESFYFRGIDSYKEKLQSVIELKGEYIKE